MRPTEPAAAGLGRFQRIEATDLPVFRCDGPEYSSFYAPGYLGVVDPTLADRLSDALAGGDSSSGLSRLPAVRELLRRAAVAREAAGARGPLQPECLTLYLHNRCNLGCAYCFSAPRSSRQVSLEAVRASAQLVAESCREKGIPLTVALHGGGEPSLDRHLADAALALVDEAAVEVGIQTFRYIATNGYRDDDTAGWLSRTFDLVSLSCDGPPEIQDSQRPTARGSPTAERVERTVDLLRLAGTPFSVRATITRQNVFRQSELVEYFYRGLGAQDIHFEPIYPSDRSPSDSASEPLDGFPAETFVEHFLAARKLARSLGVPLEYSGTRLGELHGPYCHLFRNVLNLIPGDVATACFKLATVDRATAHGLDIGAFDPATGRFRLDQTRIAALRAEARIPARCGDCFNQFHCVRGCPDACELLGEEGPSFRCQIQRAMGEARLSEMADRLWLSRNSGAPDQASAEEDRIYAAQVD